MGNLLHQEDGDIANLVVKTSSTKTKTSKWNKTNTHCSQ